VRYGECDPQGVVFNANYLAYFDVIITEFWREAIGRYNAMIEAGADMVVAESRIRFLGPAAFDDEIDFELRVARLGTTALGTAIDAHVGDRPVVAGEMRHVFIDPATKQKRPMPDDIRAGLEPYLVAESSTGAAESVAATPTRGPGAGPGAAESVAATPTRGPGAGATEPAAAAESGGVRRT
jgi:acyl-CoA thioester hydrolase